MSSSNDSFYQQFIAVNNEFQRSLSEIKSSSSPILLFGASKAGKSTFLARLLHDGTPEEFLSIISMNQRKRKEDEVAGIIVGGQASSTTLIPALRRVDDMNVVDLPGFKDTDEKRDMMISLFHKCTLSDIFRDKAPKIVMVVDSCMLYTISTFLSSYHNSMSELFNDNYRSFVDVMHFVFTHEDEFSAHSKFESSSSYENLIRIHLGDLAGTVSDPMVPRLLSRMLNNFIKVNYKTQTRADCIAALKGLLNSRTAQASLPPIPPGNFDIRVNKVDTWLHDDFREILSALIIDSEKELKAFEDTKGGMASLFENLKLCLQDLSTLKASIAEEKKIVKERSDSVLRYEEKTRNSHALLSIQRDQLASTNVTRDNFEKQVGSSEINRMMRFRSYIKSGVSGYVSSKHKVKLNLVKPEGSPDYDLRMIKPGESFDVSLFTRNKNQNSALVDAKATNSSLTQTTGPDGSRLIEAESCNEFDLVVIETIPLKDSGQLKVMTKVLDNQIAESVRNIESLEADLSEFNAELQNALEEFKQIETKYGFNFELGSSL